MCVVVSICARARVYACMRGCVSACAGSCDSIGLHFRACVASVCARPPIARPRLAVFIARPAPCFAFGATGRLSRASAAGVTWTCRTANAPWVGRASHTSVVDAAGAIYVIGGSGGTLGYFPDVWASTDGGARAGLGRGVVGGHSRGYYKG
jgi:hypothetical protein